MAITAQPTVAIALGPAAQSPAAPGRSVNDEYPGPSPYSINQYYRGGPPQRVPNNVHPDHLPIPNFGTGNIPTSGAISLVQFNGTSKRISVSHALVSSNNSTNLFTYAAQPARPLPTRYYANLPGWDITFTVGPGVIRGSPRTSTTLITGANGPAAWHPDVTLTIVNQGTIAGGSAAGTGASVGGFGLAPAGTALNGQPGLSGGTAINAQRPITITNNGVIRGGAGSGGGGGGAGSSPYTVVNPPKLGGPILIPGEAYGGGGGGGGRRDIPLTTPGGAGGGFPGPTAGTPGQAGSVPAAGLGGTGYGPVSNPTPSNLLAGQSRGGAGGPGGDITQVGSPGTAGAGQAGLVSPGSGTPQGSPTLAGSGGAGGAGGNYIIGNPLVTWPVTGTRQGVVG